MPRRILPLLILLAAVAPLRAQTSYPMITHVTPVAVQRGTTTAVTVEGQMNFAGVHTLLVEGKGVSGDVVAAPPAKSGATPAVVKSVKLKLNIAADADLGVREFRLASTLGISTLGQLLIVDAPVILEAADNNVPAKAQPLPVPGVASGRIEVAEDVDCYRISGKAGRTITCEVFCARIQDKIHDLQKHADPYLALLDAEGRELAASDDGRFADPLLTFTFPRDGDYTLLVRDAKYDGDPRWAYALAVTDRPYVQQIFPLGLNPGKTVAAEPTGLAKLVKPTVEVTAPTNLGIQSVVPRVGGEPVNPTACVVTPLPLVTEQEPNDTPAQANRVTLPFGINGRIGTKRDLDHFVFQGTKGRAVRLEVYARRFGTELTSRLDSMLDVLSPQGAVLASNDDANGKDAALVFTPRADGDYVVRVRDLNNKGGEGFGYFLEMDWAKPDFTLKCDPSKAMLGPGGSSAHYVQVTRVNGFTGPVKIDVKGLPPEVTVNPLTIPAAMTQGLLVLTASPGATTPKGFNVEITGSGEITFDGKTETVTRRATSIEEIYAPGGGRAVFPARMLSIAITGPTDVLEVRVKPARIVLKPGEEVRIEVEVVRRKDYDKSVNLDVLLRHLGGVFGNPLPPGVTSVEGKSKTLLGTGSTGHVVLKADANATPIEDVPVSVLAHVSINFVVKVSYSSKPILLSVRKQ
jgi:hypothetical protein